MDNKRAKGSFGENESYRTLLFLDEISKNHSLTQRHLSERVGIALGLTNSFIKRLVKKGYIKITSISPNRLKYLITRKGITEKTRLTYEFIQYSFLFYKEARKKLLALFMGLSQKGVRDVVFYGAGDLAEIAYLTLQETPLQLVAIVDDHKDGRLFLKYRVKQPLYLKELNYDRVIVTSIRSKEEIVERLKKINVLQYKIEVLK